MDILYIIGETDWNGGTSVVPARGRGIMREELCYEIVDEAESIFLDRYL